MKHLKIFALLMALLFIFPVFTYASREEHNLFQYMEPEITVEFGEGDFDEGTKQRIADQYAGITTIELIDGEGLNNILCTLFGHQTSDTVVTVTYHKVYEHDPRCREKFYNVTACSRCDYTVDEYLGGVDIHCHPEDSVM